MSDLALVTKPSKPPGPLAILRRRNFCLYFISSTISSLGAAATQTALVLALLVAGYSSTRLGLVLTSETVPMLLFMLSGGVAGDNWSRRDIMIGASLLRFVSLAALAIMLLLGDKPLWAVMAMSALCGIGTAFYGPAASGILPQLAGEDLQSANSLQSIVSSGAMILGPALAGFLVAFGGAATAVGLDALASLLAGAMLYFVLIPPKPSLARIASYYGDLRQGWTEFNRHFWLAILTAQIAVQNALVLSVFFVIGPAIYAALPHGVATWGVISACVGGGGILGGVLVLRLKFRRPLVMIQLCSMAMTTPIFLLALHAPAVLQMAASVLFGIGMAASNTLFGTEFQREVAPAFISRVGSIISLIVMGLAPFGYMLSGPAAASFGAHRVVAIAGAAVLLIAACVLSLRNIRAYVGQAGAA